MRRPAIAALLATIAGLFAMLAPSASAAGYTTSGYASRLLSLVNQARADNGLSALQFAGGTATVAANWTAHMASSRTLAHNPNLRSQLESHGSNNWTTYGENVGQGYTSSPDGLFRAYMQSPEHRANILTGAYRYVGVAVSFTGKLAWNTFDFVDAYGAPTVAKTAPKTTHHKAPVQHHVSRPAPAPAHVAPAPQ